MSVSNEKVNRIIEQIENGCQDNITNSEKSVDEVINIFLKDPSGKVSSIKQSPNGFDMDELRHWKEQMNQTYQVSYDREIVCYRRHMRKIIIFIKRIIRKACRSMIQPVVEEQSTFNANTTAAVNSLYNNELLTDELMIHMKEQIDAVKKETEAFEIYQSTISDEIENTYEKYKSLIFDEIEDRYKTYKIEIERRHTQDEMVLFRNARSQLYVKDEKKQSGDITNKIEESDVYSGIDYFDFENHFRGSRTEIKEAESIYIPYFQNKKSVVDLGCGRGEFLELLQESRIPYIGVDNYAEFVDYCKAKDLNVVYDDAVKYLSTQEDNSIGGIFAAQLIEHLKSDQLLKLCQLAFKKLEDGGCLIMETPNPMCLSIYTNAFYIDPSHQKPVHPKTMEYILKREGFQKVEILYPEKSKSGYRLPLLDCEISGNLDEFNNGINLLSDILFSSEDYAVVAVK